jgi:ABC-type branched-subunit amino acid transport system substrate-binding protein
MCKKSFRSLGHVGTLLVSVPACVSPAEEIKADDDRVIGALLPYTGENAAAGTNLERAMRLAAERINDAGGVAGRRLRVVPYDTHSDRDRGEQAARQLVAEGAVAIVGPEEAELAESLSAFLAEQDVLLISGGAVSLRSEQSAEGWYRIVPTAPRLGQVLAARMRVDQVEHIVTIAGDDTVARGFAEVLAEEFVMGGGNVLGSHTVQPGQPSYGELILNVLNQLQSVPDARTALVLSVNPQAASSIVQDWAALGREDTWYLSPSLRSDEFIRNVPPGLHDKMIGVSVGLPSDADEFAGVYAERWEGDFATTNAYFYFDATVLLALAYSAAAESGRLADISAVQAGQLLEAVSGPSGDLLDWQELELGLELVREGQSINYRGASGPVDFNSMGNTSAGIGRLWQIVNGRIELTSG